MDASPPILVRPRAYSPLSNEPLPLVDIVLSQQDSSVKTIRIVGRGIRTAMVLLNLELRDYPNVRILEPDQELDSIHLWDLSVFASCSKSKCKADLELQLVPWGEDEIIEYLMSSALNRCKSVMNRLKSSNDLWLANGSPRILAVVLDQMIESDHITSVEEAILCHFDSLPLSSSKKQKIWDVCFKHLFNDVDAALALHELSPKDIDSESVKFFSNKTARFAVAAKKIIEAIKNQNVPTVMSTSWPKRFIEFLGDKLKGDSQANKFLDSLSNKTKVDYAGNAASLLVHNNKDWQPSIEEEHCFEKGQFSYANWPEVSFKLSSLIQANLSMATLRKCRFQKATLTSANFFKAYLSGANFSNCHAWRADFSHTIMRAISAHKASFRRANFENAILECSDLSNTNFDGANLRNANLSNSCLTNAFLSGADLSYTDLSKSRLGGARFGKSDLRTTILEGADFTEARLKHCDFRTQSLDQITMNGANLGGAIFTGTKFTNCEMKKCNLNNAKMAEIDWEDCNLQGADFANCHFHMGSTRAGSAVDSPYPSHGTRTGYYTDEYDDHYFKTPEERRKANLCGCNLMGANVFHTDFYLVDLRGARYDNAQREHFLKCGAILKN